MLRLLGLKTILYKVVGAILSLREKHHLTPSAYTICGPSEQAP